MAGQPARAGRSGGRTLGIDYGHKRIGVALSDGLGIAAHPFAVLAAGANAGPRLAELVRTHDVERVVVGLPRSLDGSEGEAARSARHFAEKLEARLDVEIVMYDERLTSRIAEDVLLSAGTSRAGRRRKVDKVAAAVMLQGYLDRRSLGTRR